MLTEQVLPVDKVAELGPKVAQALGTKGGGRPGAFQGKASSLDGLPEALNILHQSVQQSSRGSIGYAVSHTWHTVLMPRHACCRFLGAAPDASAFALDWKADCTILQAGVFADYQSAVTDGCCPRCLGNGMMDDDVGLQPTGGAFVGTQPMLEPPSAAFLGTQQMLVPLLAPATLPPILPALRGSAAESQLLANVELAEQRLWEFNIMFDEQRRKLLSDEQGAVDNYRRVVGDLPNRPE